MYDAKKFFSFGNLSFIYPSGNIRERHGPHCKKRTYERGAVCWKLESFAKRIWAYIRFGRYL